MKKFYFKQHNIDVVGNLKKGKNGIDYGIFKAITWVEKQFDKFTDAQVVIVIVGFIIGLFGWGIKFMMPTYDHKTHEYLDWSWWNFGTYTLLVILGLMIVFMYWNNIKTKFHK